MIRTRSMHFVVLVGVFVAFTALVASGMTFPADDAASRYFKSIHGNAGLDAAMVLATTLGDVSTLFIFGTVITAIRRTRKAGMVFLIAIAVLVILVMYMKPLIGRPIPPYGFDPAFEFPENFGLESDSLAPIAMGLSYPSGHASRATALAFIVGFAVYNKSRIAGYSVWAFPVLIGITRLHVMQHYPTDVIGGLLFGGIVSVVLSNAMKLDQPFFMSRFKGRKDSKAAEDRDLQR
ncbi:MAG: phosphatase PAP2 family protein [Nitrososphaera sp.]